MTKATYWVEGEHTLLYHFEGQYLYGVLQGSLLAGGRDWKNGVAFPVQSNLRPATLADFERFRICPVGHMT